MSTTIRDVARRAGVSISTVSRVLNDTCSVSSDKRERVQEAAETLGYTPNPAARSLLKQETGGLGVLLPFVGGEFFSDFLAGIDRAAQEQSSFLMISTSHRHEGELRAALRGMHRRVDGMLIMAPEMVAQDVSALASKTGPVVFVNTRVEGDTFDVINWDNYGGIYEMTQHLLDLGHRRLAFIKGPAAAHDARERLRGFREAIDATPDAVGLELSATPDESQDDYSQESGYLTAQHAITRDPRPTAFVAANDQSAIGAIRACIDAGLRVPEDISVTGFDDVPSSRYTSPPLTSVRVPVREIGTAAIETLLNRIRTHETAEPIRKTFPVTCIFRDSVAPPSAT